MILTLPKRRVCLFPAAGSRQVAYVIGGFDAADEIAAGWMGARAALALIECADWNDALSPWAAPACFRGGADFGGGAEGFLRELTREIMPAVEGTLGVMSAERSLIGVSLGGLFALYALYRTDAVSMIGSVSGSTWFDGFQNFMRENVPSPGVRRVYLSLGDREEHTRNERLRRVGETTRAAHALLAARGIDTVLEMNAGNHFVDGPQRLIKALNWLYRE